MTPSCATVTDVKVLDGYRIELTFSDGVQGVVDLSKRILGRGGIFEPLEQLPFFRQVFIEKELGTVMWPNGADICPELLYAWVTSHTVPPVEAESETVAS